MIDYKELLIKYMLEVLDSEGVTYANNSMLSDAVDSYYTQEELDALAEVVREAQRRFNGE